MWYNFCAKLISILSKYLCSVTLFNTPVLTSDVRNAMAHAQKPDLVFQRNGRFHLNRRGCQLSRMLAAEECGSADSNCIDRVPTYSARLLATHSIRIFTLHFPSRASPCANTFRTRYTWSCFTFVKWKVSVSCALERPWMEAALVLCKVLCIRAFFRSYWEN